MAAYASFHTSRNNHVLCHAHDLVLSRVHGGEVAEKPNAHHEESHDNQNAPDTRVTLCNVLA